MAAANEAWHLLFKVRNSSLVGPWEDLDESFEFDDPGLVEINCKTFCWHTKSWLNLSHHLMLNSLESDNGNGGGCSCFLMMFHVKIHGILNLEQNVRSLGWALFIVEALGFQEGFMPLMSSTCMEIAGGKFPFPSGVTSWNSN